MKAKQQVKRTEIYLKHEATFEISPLIGHVQKIPYKRSYRFAAFDLNGEKIGVFLKPSAARDALREAYETRIERYARYKKVRNRLIDLMKLRQLLKTGGPMGRHCAQATVRNIILESRAVLELIEEFKSLQSWRQHKRWDKARKAKETQDAGDSIEHESGRASDLDHNAPSPDVRGEVRSSEHHANVSEGAGGAASEDDGE